MSRLLVPAALLCTLAWYAGYRMAEPEKQTSAVVQRIEVNPGPSVVVALQSLARLEGASFHMQRVIDLREKQSRFWGLVEAEDAILLVASGEVTAGVDLGQLSSNAIVIEEKAHKVKVILPHAQVLSSKIDNDRTYVHTRTTDPLAQQAISLESQARKVAEVGFVQAAIEADLLRDAELSISRTVSSLIRSLGYTQVDVVFEGETAQLLAE